jgi:hypothetical protein
MMLAIAVPLAFQFYPPNTYTVIFSSGNVYVFRLTRLTP